MKTQNRKNKTLFKHILRPMAMSVAMFASMAVNAQEARRETIDFNITEISNFDHRTIFIHNLWADARFDVVNGEQDGVFVVSTNNAFGSLNVEEGFAQFREESAHLFSIMDKDETAMLARECKANLPAEFANSLMMDIYRQSRDNSHCATAYPFCTDNGMYEFPAGVDAGSGESGPSYDCLYSTPNPAWYYLRIDQPGDIDIYMYSTPSEDIDFCCWGPFEDPYTPCPNGLTSNKVVSCSYSTSWNENCLIPASAQTGEYYILIITNYSNDPCNINFSKVDGSGTTDCGILPPLVANDGPYCEGQTIHLTANGQPGATYSWAGPNHFSSSEQNPVIPNCNPSMSGTYTCTIVLNGQSNNATTEVEVFQQATPAFTATTVCQGEATQFDGIAGEGVVYNWEFGDGQSETGQSVSHTYAQAGTYQVRLAVANEDGTCPGEITQTVTVDAMPNAGPDEMITIAYGSSAQLTSDGGSGNFTYQWEPANMVTNSNAQNTQTIVLTQSQVYTLTITNPAHPECTDSKEVTVRIEGGALTATVTAEHDAICLGENTRLNVTAFDGTGNYSYSWTHDPSLNTANITVSPTQTTEYVCNVNDGQTTWPVRVTVTVNMPEVANAVVYSEECDSISVTWTDGQGNTQDVVFTENTTYTFEGLTEAGCHLEQTYHIRDMKYTPSPSKVLFKSLDGDFFLTDNDTVAVVHETEFFTFNYSFTISETGESLWDECIWNISKSTWDIEHSLSDTHQSSTCTVYIREKEETPVELTCRLRNSCMDEGEYKTYKFYLKSSWFGVDEQSGTAKVSIVPNPNNGQMRISFDQMEGRANVKVFDMRGNKIDNFETTVAPDGTEYEYNMKPFADGVYFFVISDSHTTVTRKVVIIH